MLNRQIYRTLFNLDKDRQDRGLPAGNPAIQPMQTPLGAMGGSEQAPAPLPDEVKKRLPVPTPPSGQPPVVTTAVVDQYVPSPTNASDEEERKRQAALAAAAQEPIAMMGDADGPASDPNYGVTRPNAFAERDKASRSTSVPAAEEEVGLSRPTYRGKQFRDIEQRRAFAADPDGSVAAAAAGDPAQRVAELNKTARIAMGLGAVPVDRPDDRPKSAKELKREVKDAKRAAEDADYQERLQAALRYPNPQNANERRQNRLDELRFKAENPRNEDRGVKGFIREMLQNFSYGLSGAASVPGISIPQALMLGGVGAGAGLLNRSWNEQRMAQQQLDGAYKDAAFESDLANKERALGIQEQGVGIRRDAEERQKEKVLLDADYKTRSLGIQEKYRNEYLDLLRTRDVYKNANDKKKAEQAERRIKVLEDRYKLDERKAGVQMGSTTMQTKERALKMAEVIEQRIAALGADATPEQRQILEAALASLAPSLRQ